MNQDTNNQSEPNNTKEQEKPSKEYKFYAFSRVLIILLTVTFLVIAFHWEGHGIASTISVGQIIISMIAVLLTYFLIVSTPPEFTTFNDDFINKLKEALSEGKSNKE